MEYESKEMVRRRRGGKGWDGGGVFVAATEGGDGGNGGNGGGHGGGGRGRSICVVVQEKGGNDFVSFVCRILR